MNTANLQIEGLLLMTAELLRLLKYKGTLSDEEIERLLTQVEADASARQRLSQPNRKAVTFPARFLRQALATDGNENARGFEETTARAGQES